jgi:DNA-binding GntR family transcriptional regulator
MRKMQNRRQRQISSAVRKTALKASRPRRSGGFAVTLKERPESLTTVVFDAIRRAIIDQTIPPGSPVTEDQLAAQLSVSKTPVREALKILREIGLVEDLGRRGGRVVPRSRRAMQEASEAREAIEGLLAEKAALRGTPEQKQAIIDAARMSLERAKTGDDRGFEEWNQRFHRSITAAADNGRLSKMLDDTIALITALRLRDLAAEGDLVEFATHHQAIAKEIARGDAEAAGRSARKHVARSREYHLGFFDKKGQDGD